MPRPRRRATLAVALALPLSASPLLAAPASAVPALDSPVFINEIHYDNGGVGGVDVGEFVEVANPRGLDLTGWSIVLYNGSNSMLYGTRTLSGTGAFQVVAYPTDGIQNGAPDALALVDAGGTPVQFLSYEGTVTAASGPAAGLQSTDLGVREAGSEPAGQSLQLTGTGTTAGAFRWVGPRTASPGAANAGQSFGGTPPPVDPPIEPPVEPPAPALRRISEVQGTGATTPLAGQQVRVEAVVTSLFERGDVLDGFFVQEQDTDADTDPQTSEGLFVFCRAACPTGLATGDRVQVTGTAGEAFGMTQLTVSSAASVQVLAAGQARPTAARIALPAAAPTRAEATFETVEGMVVTVAGTVSVNEFFNLARFGTISVVAGARPYQFTHTDLPSVTGYATAQAELAKRVLLLDDDNNDQNDAVTGPESDEPYPFPGPGLSLTRTLRGGDTATDVTGVMHWSFSGAQGTDAWRLRPVDGAAPVFARTNPRTATPDAVGGRLRVASFNVLNYFTTLDRTASNSAGPCGPAGTADCRGADSAEELVRQRAKTVAAITAIDPDVAGLIEIQNDDGTATQDLVDALNAATAPGTYDYVRTGVIGTDAIKQAFVYQPAAVQPVGAYAVLDRSVDPNYVDTANRPALAQTFREVATGERVTVAVNHLKSKGSSCTGDPDLLDGQGNCNVTRRKAAVALASWLAKDPTRSGDRDVLVIGDLNSYRNEDPIRALEAAGYTDLVEQEGGPKAYGYLFDGQLGYIDHALANASLLPQVTGATEWHINADEVQLLDYNDTVQTAGESMFERESTAFPLYAADPYRSSDHDPVVVGLDLDQTGPRLLSVDPKTGTELADRDADVVATFDEPLATGGTATLTGPFGPEPVAVRVVGSTLVVDPARKLPGRPGTYTLTYRVQDALGNASTTSSTFVVRPGRP